MIREVKDALEKRAISQKKISKYNSGLDTIITLIDYVNHNMGEDDVEVWPGHSIHDVLVPRELQDFVYPASIRYNAADRRTRNLIPERVKQELNITYNEYVEACDSFRGNFKKDANSDMVTLASLRKHVSLNDVIGRISINGKVNYYAGYFVPIPVVDISCLFSDRYLNDNVSSVLEDYVAEMRFNN